MSKLLSEAKKRFKKGDLFLSATGNLINPIPVGKLLVSEIYEDTISNESGGIICMPDENGNIVWAKKFKIWTTQ